MTLQEIGTKLANGEWEMADGVLVIEPGVWHANDGNAEITVNCDSSKEAAEEYVSTGEWGDRSETTWITVSAWREGVDQYGSIVRLDEDTHTITLESEEPECTEDEHDWRSPREIVGGIKDNPGVWGHGGGVVMDEVCMHCGCEKVTDTWAQNPCNGVQGLTSVTYHAGKYADEVEQMREVAEEA